MELYRNVADQEVKFRVPSGELNYELAITSSAHEAVVDMGEPVTPDEGDGHLIVKIPYKHTAMDGTVKIIATFTIDGEETELARSFDVVTPLFTYDEFTTAELKSINNPTESDLRDLERFIRHIIEAYTGQSFGFSKRTYEVENPNRGVTFDAPMVEFTGASSRFATGSVVIPGTIPYELFDDRFGFRLDWGRYYFPKTDTFLPVSSPAPRHYQIAGLFGYEEVPQDVKEAARILIGLFNCEQSLWRDRYIENLRNADGSTLKYHEGAYVGTGSVSADQLLAKYVRSEYSAAVI